VKDLAQDVVGDVTEDAAENVLGAAEDDRHLSAAEKIIITPVACPQLPPTPTPS